MKFFIGQKHIMTQVWNKQGQPVAVTPIQGDPCFVVQMKTKEKDGYDAVKIGFYPKKKLNKPILGMNTASKTTNLSRFEEFHISETDSYAVGQKIGVESFKPGDHVMVQGISKGRGFQGVVKRHGFSGSPATHGHKDQLRKTGAIGAGGPQRVFKGKRLPGHMGSRRVTVKNLKVAKIDATTNTIYIQGAVPGSLHSWLRIETE